ncbi:migration and invasion enhancer 1-like, partial [Nematolebias whitei]|uniref:migration and invasion enhancer 1-like n=1 Tax=Nematolebias whitei TaxID=451745 RepID=UPI00189819EB
GYFSRYQELAVLISKKFPGTGVKGIVGRPGAFEVKINGQLVFSKLDRHGFPCDEDVLNQVKNAYDGKPLERILRCQENCTIL